MVELSFEELTFHDLEDKLKVIFLKIYYFYIDKSELLTIGEYKVDRNKIMFKTSKKESNIEQKFHYLLDRGFNTLMSSINGKPCLYIHKNSGIPLMGTNEFGIIDRGTNTIEIKPITTCNIDCIFCSVDHLKRIKDIVVDSDYLVEELNKVIDIKENKVNIHIGSQGDTSLYDNLERLVRLIRKNPKVNAISIVSNGILLTKTRVQRLIDAGMTHFHISLHSLDPDMASKLANAPYPVKKVMEYCEYIATHAKLLLVPVWLPGLNDKDIEDVILFGKKIGASLGIQNFLEYKFGKKPVNPLPMKLFYKKLDELEAKLGVNLTTIESDLEFHEDTKLEKPFRKNQVIEVNLFSSGRLRNTALGVSGERVITVISTNRIDGKIKVKLVRDKDNIFVGVATTSRH